jgi:hypothetical protein
MGSVTIDGVATEDQTLSANTSTLTDEDGLGSFMYEWLRDETPIAGATGSTYLLTQDDVGASISVTVAYTDGGNAAESLTSTSTGPVANLNDPPVGSVTIDGVAAEDQTLYANTSALTDEDGLGQWEYEWLRGGAPITGATGGTYYLTQDDVGALISVKVAYTDALDIFESVLSGAVGPVANVNNPPPAVPSMGTLSLIALAAALLGFGVLERPRNLR